MLTAETLTVGDRCNWKNQDEKLAFMGSRFYPGDQRRWYQFEKVDEPGKVWCEILESDLYMLEKTKDEATAK